jgi:hypothetical protein
MRAMSLRHLGIATVVLVVDTALLLLVGASMWRGAPSPADAAVGKGLVTLAVALALPTLAAILAYLEARPTPPVPDPGRSDWDAV